VQIARKVNSVVLEAFLIFRDVGKNVRGGAFRGGEFNSDEDTFFNS